MKQCRIVGCSVVLSKASKLDICPLCRHGLYYWRKKRPAEVLERRTKLIKYNNRLTEIIGNRGVK